jgi:hypothetical protein
MRSCAIGVFLALIVAACGTSLSGVVLPLKGAADADYPALDKLPRIELKAAELAKAQQNQEQLLCDTRGGQVTQNRQLLYAAQETVGMWKAPATEGPEACPGAIANDEAVVSAKSRILQSKISAFGVSCTPQGAFFQVNAECFGPYDRVYCSPSMGRQFGFAAYSAARGELLHATVGNTGFSGVFVLCDLRKYVPNTEAIQFVAELGGPGNRLSGYLFSPQPGQGQSGWFVNSPRGSVFGDSCSFGTYQRTN